MYGTSEERTARRKRGHRIASCLRMIGEMIIALSVVLFIACAVVAYMNVEIPAIMLLQAESGVCCVGIIGYLVKKVGDYVEAVTF